MGTNNGPYQFNGFTLDISERQLSNSSGPVHLTPKAFDVLVHLVSRAGQLVAKEEIMQSVWPDAFVEEANLARIVHTLRKAFDQVQNGDRFIETVPTKGYRFIANVVSPNLSDDDSLPPELVSKPTDAYQAFQLSRYYFQKISVPHLMKARFWLEEAIRFDPGFGNAYAALAEIAVLEVVVGLSSPAENFPKAREALQKAAEINQPTAELFAAAGVVSLICDWNFSKAEQNLSKALELNPFHAFTHKYLGEAHMYQCRFDAAQASLRRAVELEPMDLHHGVMLTIAQFLARDYKKLIEDCDKVLSVNPGFVGATWMRCWGYEQTGRAEEAIDDYNSILNQPGGILAWRWKGYAEAIAGRREDALATAAVLDQESKQHYLSPTFQALIYAGLNEPETACECLEDAFEKRDPWFLWTAADPRLDSIRSNVRFKELVQKLWPE